MTNTPNTDQLHDANVIEKDKMTDEQVKAIESLSQEEIDHLKSIDKNLKASHPTAGVIL